MNEILTQKKIKEIKRKNEKRETRFYFYRVGIAIFDYCTHSTG
jgi:hypothetical protein